MKIHLQVSIAFLHMAACSEAECKATPLTATSPHLHKKVKVLRRSLHPINSPASCPWNAIEARVLLPHPGHRHQVPSLSSDLLPVGADLLQSFCHPRVLDPPNWS